MPPPYVPAKSAPSCSARQKTCPPSGPLQRSHVCAYRQKGMKPRKKKVVPRAILDVKQFMVRYPFRQLLKTPQKYSRRTSRLHQKCISFVSNFHDSIRGQGLLPVRTAIESLPCLCMHPFYFKTISTPLAASSLSRLSCILS